MYKIERNKTKTVTKKCELCKTPFTYIKRWWDSKRYCGNECARAGMMVESKFKRARVEKILNERKNDSSKKRTGDRKHKKGD